MKTVANPVVARAEVLSPLTPCGVVASKTMCVKFEARRSLASSVDFTASTTRRNAHEAFADSLTRYIRQLLRRTCIKVAARGRFSRGLCMKTTARPSANPPTVDR